MQYLTYGMLLIWFWRVPVASISQQLVQPFGNAIATHTSHPLKKSKFILFFHVSVSQSNHMVV
jgi:hypothetical protein